MTSFSERLDDVLSRRGFATYRRIRKFLTRHTLTINGQRALTGGTRINLFSDKILLDEKPFQILPDTFIMMNKPSGYICSSKEDPQKSFPTVYSLLDDEILNTQNNLTLHTIGRLDTDTEGLLIFTTNGDFSHRVCMPEFHVKKTYRIILKENVSEEEQARYIKECAAGFFLPREWNSKGFTCKPSELKFNSDNECELTISEGKFHQVKRMILQLGNSVAELKRLSMGNLFLDKSLQPGQWRNMTEKEICSVLA